MGKIERNKTLDITTLPVEISEEHLRNHLHLTNILQEINIWRIHES